MTRIARAYHRHWDLECRAADRFALKEQDNVRRRTRTGNAHHTVGSLGLNDLFDPFRLAPMTRLNSLNRQNTSMLAARKEAILIGVLASGFGLASCRAQVDRSQTLLAIDTDMPLAGSSDALRVAAMDTVRIDVLTTDATSSVVETRDFVLADARDWPLTVGVVPPARLRIRLFQARLPRAELTIDRLVEWSTATSTEDVSRLRVVLSGDCIGLVADLPGRTTCVDRNAVRVPASAGIGGDTGLPTIAGTWDKAIPVPCTGPDVPDAPCIAGGFDVLGDPSLAGMPNLYETPLPLRTVVVSPFRMDTTEYTVGRLRAKLATGWTPREGLPSVTTPTIAPLRYCTWLDPADASADALPLNCSSLALARELCGADGGRLPTEAEWEHAARGRGDGRIFPWGNEPPACCTTSASRSPDESIPAACPRSLLEPAGSHRASTSCPGGGDVTPDGIVDLGGSLGEWTDDTFEPITECFAPGLLVDPRCEGGGPVVSKGADWTAGLARTRSAYRTIVSSEGGDTTGFRCVYPEMR